MRKSEITKKASLLRNGQSVEIDGNWFRAVRLNVEDADPCHECEVDCLCISNVSYVCSELELSYGGRWLLKLVTKQK